MAQAAKKFSRGRFGIAIDEMPSAEHVGIFPDSVSLFWHDESAGAEASVCITEPVSVPDLIAAVDAIKQELDAVLERTLATIIERAESRLNFVAVTGNKNGPADNSLARTTVH